MALLPIARARRVASRFTSAADVLLAVRVMGWALVLPLMKHIMPLRSLVALMQRAPVMARRDPALEERIVTFARWSARIVRWSAGGNCLERGLIAYRYLCAAGANPVLVVGIGKSEAAGVTGHAWVLLDGEPAGEPRAAVESFAPMVSFDARGKPLVDQRGDLAALST